tara:strand:- start:39 stop:1049 length:1011 start_codon:yes stop_codon:yes gene_type:complete
MGVAKEFVELGVKKIAPAVKKFVKENLSEVNADIFYNMAKHDQPAFNDMYQKIDTITKTQDQVLREDLGVTVLQDFDKRKADSQRLQTARDVQRWVGDRKSSELSRTGFRKNVLDFGYDKRLQNPDIPPSEISQAFKEEMGTMSYAGEQQKVLSGGSKPTKTGQRRLAVQDVAENKARRQKNIQERNEHGYTSPEAKKAYNKQNKEVAAENKQAVKDAKAQGIKVKPGQQFVSLEHDIALSHGRKWWKKVGNIGNDPENLFIQRNQLARQFKDNIENWFYPKSKDFVIKSDRSNLKDLIIMSVETGQEVLRIPMPDDFATGIPDNIIQQLKELIGK